ncbi:MAG: S-layer homology domain-containing protein [Firmicutes bacterium]|nr:S-layer homology domain-containing protein [Bacillota bacterium]
MKNSKRLLALLLALVMLLALPALAMAKTSSDPIAEPAGNQAVFTVQAGDRSAAFTWDEISGKGAYSSFTNSYAAKVDGEQTTQEWTGVKLADLLAAAEKQMGVTFAADYKISAIAADGFVSVFTVADVKDAANNFMVAGEPCSNYDDEKTYPDSYTRILKTAETSNLANIRCVTGVKVLDAAGKELTFSSGKPGKTQGGDIANSVFYIAVKETADAPYKFYYYTRADLNAYDDKYDFKYVDHSVPKTVTGRGASLANLIADISDATITGDMIVQYAESDGYHADASTAIEDSAYKDKVAWLTSSHTTSGGDTAAAVQTMVCLTSWTKYDNPDENNVDSTEWEDADLNSGYLRAYRQRDDANSAVIKTLMGVVISPSGDVFTGEDGYTLTAKSTDGKAMRIIEPSTGIAYASQKVTGLVPGMQYCVKAPTITGATVSGPASQIITAGSGVDTKAEFTYKESTWLTVGDTAYTLSTFESLPTFTQTPTKDEVDAHGTPYGYYNAMYYRYTGIWLNDLVSGDAVLKAADGTTVNVAAADTEKYFVVSGYTASKSSTNVSEGKRYTYALTVPQVIIPGEGTLVGEAEAAQEGNKKVTVAVDKLNAIQGEAVPYFTDLGNYGWAEDAIYKLTSQGVVKGQGAGKYGPAENIKRGDFILMLVRAYDLECDSKSNFADVKAGSYYFDAIACAKALGIAKGDGTNFQPESSITRQEAMALLYRTLEITGHDMNSYSVALNTFTDVDKVADWAVEPISALVGARIIQGSNNELNPLGNLTRAEMAVALNNALENIK